jgi:hypothetical protein
MRKIKKTLPVSEISYYNRDGALQTATVNSNVRTVEQAVKALMKLGLYNVLIDDVKVRKYTYTMDAEQFFANAVLTDTADETEPENENVNE